ncbi:MAG: hypothetical protein HPY79_11985 [Bacteroidales bacterium]|nr:hypothetical protein [Bacteroidales bacterium]
MKKLFFTSFICLMTFFATAQIKLLDLSVIPIIKTDSVSGQSSNTTLDVRFKIKNSNTASKVFVLFGTTQNLGDIYSIEANIIENAGNYYILYNGMQTPINNYNAEIKIELTPAQNAAYNYITLFVKDVNGTDSNKLYFVK